MIEKEWSVMASHNFDSENFLITNINSIKISPCLPCPSFYLGLQILPVNLCNLIMMVFLHKNHSPPPPPPPQFDQHVASNALLTMFLATYEVGAVGAIKCGRYIHAYQNLVVYPPDVVELQEIPPEGSPLGKPFLLYSE